MVLCMYSCHQGAIGFVLSRNLTLTLTLPSIQSLNRIYSSGLPSLTVLLQKRPNLSIRCAGFGGRFRPTPFSLPEEVPLWLEVARKQVLHTSLANFRALLVEVDEEKTGGWEKVHESGRESTIVEEKETIVRQPWRVLVTSRHRIFASAFHLEARFMGFKTLKEMSLYTVPECWLDRNVLSRLSRMRGLRAVMEPLAVGSTVEELVDAVCSLEIGGLLSGCLMSHECLSPTPGRLPRLSLKAKLVTALQSNDARVEDVFGTGANPHFVVVETKHGYLFGLVLFAPSPPMTSFSDAPRQWSGGLPAELAAVAVNIAASSGDSLLDPCCGSGTILFEAHRRGIRTFGSDLHLGILRFAYENLTYFGIHTIRNWGSTCPIRGPHNPRQVLPVEERPSTPLYATETELVHAPSVGGRTLLEEDKKFTWKSLKSSSITVVKEFGIPSSEEHDESRLSQGNIFSLDTNDNGINALEVDLIASEFGEISIGKGEFVSLEMIDARKTVFVGDCIVTNLPFNRFVKVEEEVIVEILTHLRGRARRYVFFAGLPIARTLESLGYKVLNETPVCPRSRRFLAVAVMDPNWLSVGME